MQKKQNCLPVYLKEKIGKSHMRTCLFENVKPFLPTAHIYNDYAGKEHLGLFVCF